MRVRSILYEVTILTTLTVLTTCYLLLLLLTYFLLTKHIICLMRSFASLETLSSLGKVYRQSTMARCVCMLLSRLQASGCRMEAHREGCKAEGV